MINRFPDTKTLHHDSDHILIRDVSAVLDTVIECPNCLSKSIFINPPFKTVDKWVQKASESVASNPGQVIVMLIAARTDTQRFHKYIYNKPNVETRFLPGRVKFEGTKNSAPFPSMVVIFR